VVDFGKAGLFLFSENMRLVAQRNGRWHPGEPFDFTRIFAGPEPGRKYYSGRRMWAAFGRLAPAAAKDLSPDYVNYVTSVPYPATLPSKQVNLTDMMETMRNYYQDTKFDMRHGMAAGPFGTPDRVFAGKGNKEVAGSWERTIATQKSILSYVLVARPLLPSPVGGVEWLGMHAAHTTLYVPFPLGMLSPQGLQVPLPEGYTTNDLNRVGRGVGAVNAARFVFNAAQLRFDAAIEDVREGQRLWEQDKGMQLLKRTEEDYLNGKVNLTGLTSRFCDHAVEAVAAWWEMSDQINLKYGDTCKLGYPAWWLRSPSVDYAGGPPPSPRVPPLHIEVVDRPTLRI